MGILQVVFPESLWNIRIFQSRVHVHIDMVIELDGELQNRMLAINDWLATVCKGFLNGHTGKANSYSAE